MSAYVVWLDLDRAKIFKIMPGMPSSRILRRTEMKHHTNADPENHKKTGPFFGDISDRIQDASEVLLLGPGLAKDHFRSFVDERFPDGLSRKIVGLATVDHPTDNQILAKSREFFKLYDLYA